MLASKHVVLVSIHAPTRGATMDCNSGLMMGAVSIHAPTRGATYLFAFLGHGDAVSIHAPTRGATETGDGELARLEFQSTRPRGARHNSLKITQSLMSFQSTRPRGARRWRFSCPIWNFWFQSTRPRGARPASVAETYSGPMFQSTRPRGARHPFFSYTNTDRTFQSTRPRGARPLLPRRLIHSRLFQSTRPRGARPPMATSEALSGRRFNPRAHAGRDIESGILIPVSDCFNPRAHAGRDRRLSHRLADHRHVSIHAPTRGATVDSARNRYICSRFNPRAHAGRDRPYPFPASPPPCFNPRAHAGRDLRAVRSAFAGGVFQSTRPRGARPLYC